MMKKLILLVSIAALMLGVMGAAFAGPNDNWVINFKATDNANASGNITTNSYGTNADAGDNDDGLYDAQQAVGTGSAAVLGAFDLGAGTAGYGYYNDIRAKMSAATQPNYKSWNLKLFVQSNFNSTKGLKLRAYNASGANDLLGLPDGWKVKLSVITDATGANSGYTYTWDGTTNQTSTSPAFTLNWTAAQTRNLKGVENAVIMKLETIVPEPGSMVALFSGLVGLVGFGIRRRK